jgi:hypothetical protein
MQPPVVRTFYPRSSEQDWLYAVMKEGMRPDLVD